LESARRPNMAANAQKMTQPSLGVLIDFVLSTPN
jgi:hypothetical protein